MRKVHVGVIVVVCAAVTALGVVAGAGASNGATATHFTASYGPPQITCSGERIVKTGSNAFVKDSETCIASTDFYAPGTYDLAAPSFGGWCSDYEGFSDAPYCRLAVAGTLVVSANRDGSSTWRITAYYAP